ncbi:MAG TPA: HD domain-containing phosphohydrolase, partial [Fibrobacteria bacterium]|nr:HD domain-containing phosphohydrolase [Fibrobacteria bacterium]
RGRLVAKKLSQLKLLDQPWGPALSQFMSQVSVRDRTEEYKEDNRRRFEEATAQVRILFGKITRREVASSALIRAVVGSFMDTFMKDRNLLLNLAAHSGSNRDYLYDHSLKLCLISLSIASASGYSRAQAVDIAQGALLADIGMLLIPEAIRLKRGKLTQGEILEMQKHPLLGLTLLEPIHNLSEAILLIPWQHHERLSGTGYPEKRAGAAVSRYSRIVGIADIFTALINKRSWREAQVPYDAMVAILGMGGQGLLDGEHIRGFLRTLSIFPLGSLVRLSTGSVAKVVAPNPVEFTKPLVSVLTAPGGTSLPREKIHQVDLARDTGTTIVEALPEKAISHSILDGF